MKVKVGMARTDAGHIAVVERRGRHRCPSDALLPKAPQFLMTYNESFVNGKGRTTSSTLFDASVIQS